MANKGSYVEIYVRGTEKQLGEFRQALELEAPERSAILKTDVHDCEDRPFSRFDIIESEKETGDIFVSPDIATCPKCRAELFDPQNRRYMHPFINCTACGPRLTILDSMPYDRERTSMGEFPMCPACEYEYTHPETRRYDAPAGVLQRLRAGGVPSGKKRAGAGGDHCCAPGDLRGAGRCREGDRRFSSVL